jgi:hypothetical protein
VRRVIPPGNWRTLGMEQIQMISIRTRCACAIPRQQPGIPRPPILHNRTNCINSILHRHPTVHVDKRQHRRHTMGCRIEMLVHGKPLR